MDAPNIPISFTTYIFAFFFLLETVEALIEWKILPLGELPILFSRLLSLKTSL